MTTYVIRVTGNPSWEPKPDGSVELTVELPTESEETEFIHIDREDGEPLAGVTLAHGEVVAGHWPGGEEWCDEMRVPNEIGYGPANAENGEFERLRRTDSNDLADLTVHLESDQIEALARHGEIVALSRPGSARVRLVHGREVVETTVRGGAT